MELRALRSWLPGALEGDRHLPPGLLLEIARGQTVEVCVLAWKLRGEGAPVGEAVIRGCETRLRAVTLHRDKQEAEIYDAATAAAEVEKRLPSDRIIGEVTPTGRTKDLLGVRCEEYSFALKGPLTATVLLVRSGTAWLAKQGPGVEEYLSFYRAAGTVLAAGSIRAPKEVLALSRTDTEFYRRIAALGGMPYAIDTKISVEGTGLAARMLGNILNLSESITTTAVDTTPLREEMFAVPTGWKTKFIGYAKDKRH